MSFAHIYRVCDLVFTSNMPLPELTTVKASAVECTFEVLRPRKPSPGNFVWFHHWNLGDSEKKEAGAKTWVQFARTNTGYLLRFPSCGDFFLSKDVREIQCCPLLGVPEITIRHLFIDQVIPLVLSRRESMVLHASSVLTSHGVIAFVGKSGRGKSTLAASFARRGCAIVSDDCLVLRAQHGRWTALPSYPGIRLWPSTAEEILGEATDTADVAHYSVKRRFSDVSQLTFAKSPAPLRSIFFLLDHKSVVSIEKLPSAKAFLELVSFAYNLDVQDVGFLRRQFESVGQLTTALPTYAISYPPDFALLSGVGEVILSRLMED